MSIVALVAEAGTNRTAPKRQRTQMFVRSTIICSALLVLFIVAYTQVTTQVDIMHGRRTVSFVTGFNQSPHRQCIDMSPAKCIADVLTFRDTEIDTYFGNENRKLSSLILELLYVGVFASLGFVVVCVLDLNEPPSTATGKKRKISRK
jgi:hypothetical protein